MSWEEAMWAELKAQSDTDQVITTGAWITRLIQEVLPALGRYRRAKVLECLALPDWEATKLAETIGSRRNTITRLAEEGRAAAREDRAREAEVAEEWPEVTEPGTVNPAEVPGG